MGPVLKQLLLDASKSQSLIAEEDMDQLARQNVVEAPLLCMSVRPHADQKNEQGRIPDVLGDKGRDVPQATQEEKARFRSQV